MNLRTLSIIICLLISLQVKGQIYFDLKSGFASYQQKDLKEWQSMIIEQSDIDLDLVNDFPSYILYQGNFIYDIGKLDFGLGFEYHSSGGRMGYWDETGNIVEDQLLSKYGFRAMNRYSLTKDNKSVELQLSSTFILTTSNLIIKSELNLGGQNLINEKAKFFSNTYSYEPGLVLKWHISKTIGLESSIAYEWTPFKGKFKFNNNKEAILGMPNNSRFVGSNWNGIKVLGGLFVNLHSKK